MSTSAIAVAMAVAVFCAIPSEQPTPSTVPVTSAHAKTEQTVRLSQNFDVRVNETVAIDGESLRITFERVVEDSRCPTNTTCFWAGDAVVRVALLGANAERGTLNLHTLSETAAQGSFQKFRVRLVQLAPVPHDGGSVPAEQYVATLIVT